MLDQALAQIPDAHRHGTDMLIRTDGAGSAKAFLAHIRELRKRKDPCLLLGRVRHHRAGPTSHSGHLGPSLAFALDQDGTSRAGAEIPS